MNFPDSINTQHQQIPHTLINTQQRILATTALAALTLLLAKGCATLKPNADPVAVRAEQTLSVALLTVDAALKFESENREQLPDSIREAAAAVRSNAARAFTSADDVRLAYKRGAATESKLLLALTLLEELVIQVKWWTGISPASMAGLTATETLVIEAEVYGGGSPASWSAAIPLAIELAKQIYGLINGIRDNLRQDMQWNAEEDAVFRSRLLQTITQDHWRAG